MHVSWIKGNNVENSCNKQLLLLDALLLDLISVQMARNYEQRSVHVNFDEKKGTHTFIWI